MTEFELEQAAKEYEKIKNNDRKKCFIIDKLCDFIQSYISGSIFFDYQKVEGKDRKRKVHIRFNNGRGKECDVDVSGMDDIDMIIAVLKGIKNNTVC